MRKIIIHKAEAPETGFWVECPSLGIASEGETVDEAISMIREAIDLWIEATLEKGGVVPPEDVEEFEQVAIAI